MQYFTAIFALVIGGVSIWMSQKLIRIYFQVKNWSKSRATILSKEVFLNKKSNSQKSPYGIKVEYLYQQNGKEYRGSNFFLVELIGGWKSFTKTNGDNKLKEIPSEVTLYVNPKEPTQSVVKVDGIVFYVLIFFMGLFSTLYGVSQLL